MVSAPVACIGVPAGARPPVDEPPSASLTPEPRRPSRSPMFEQAGGVVAALVVGVGVGPAGDAARGVDGLGLGFGRA